MPELLKALGDAPASVPFAALVTFGILAIYRNWLVPGKRVEEVRKDRDDRLAEQQKNFDERNVEREAHYDEMMEDVKAQRDQWRTAYFTSEQTVSTLLSQNGELKELARTGVHLLNALPQPPSEGGDQA